MSKVTVEFYNMMATIARLEGQLDKAQRWLDNEVLKDCQPYVPMRSGNLMDSGVTGTTIGSGNVVYNAPYARKMYYGEHFNFSKAKHPQACAMWFEKAKAVNSEKWKNGVQKIVKG